MHTTEIFIEGKPLDLYTDGKLKYKMQVNRIADVKDRQASFLNSTNVPKTANNIRLLRGLSLPSDTSNIPYTKPNCELKVDGFNFISKGWLGVDEGADDFKIKLYVGIVQFFKAIEGKKIGTDLDLSAVNHPKDLANVLASFESPNYRYLIGDYNGKTHFGSDDKIINIDYLVPSINVKYIWDLIHTTFGFTYSGLIFDSSHFNNLWITYPKPIPLGTETELENVTGFTNIFDRNANWGVPEQFYTPMLFGGLDQNRKYRVPEKGRYRIILEGSVDKRNPAYGYYYMRVNQANDPYHTTANPVTLMTVTSTSSQPYKVDMIFDFEQYDELDFYNLIWANGAIVWTSTNNLRIYKVDDAQADFSTELKDFAITDFVKDILNMFGLTPFTNELDSNIDYRLITERFVTAEAVDWSHKFVRRKSEKYVYDSFAQSNYFRYQYADKENDFHDGEIKIGNVNLTEKKEIFKSKMYSPELAVQEFYVGSQGTTTTRVFKMYDKSVKEQGGGTRIEYKALDKRFHYCRSNMFPTNVEIGSEKLNSFMQVNKIPLIDYSGLPWQRLLNTFYPTLGRVITDSRVHEIELVLKPTDVMLLDMNKLIYFEQEQQYYVIDSLEYDGDEVGVGRFVRAKRDPNAVVIPIDPTTPEDYKIKVAWSDTGTIEERTGFSQTETIVQTTLSYPASDPITSLTWQRLSNGVWIDINAPVTNTPLVVALVAGQNEFRVKGITQNGISYFSEVLKYFRKTANCIRYRTSLFLTSGECLDISYVDCYTGKLVYDSTCNQGGAGSTYSLSACAVEGSVVTNGNLQEDGLC